MSIVVTLTPLSTSPWTCPDGVFSVQVRCWAPGGNGGNVAPLAAGAGGGGGAFGQINSYPVVPGNTYAFTVGSGGSVITCTWVSAGVFSVSAGKNASANVAGAGGSAASGTAVSLTNAGGNGAVGTVASNGGGGGGCAGPGGTGGAASGASGGSSGGTDAGVGGNGPTTSSNGQAGNIYGGGGSGALNLLGTGADTGGAGADGAIILSFDALQPATQDDSIPVAKPWMGYAFTLPNLLLTTLAVTGLFREPLAFAAPPKYQVECEQHHNPVILGVNPAPRPRWIDQSAPPPKYQPQVDITPNLTTSQLKGVPLVFSSGKLSTSAPITKYAIEVDVYQNTLVTTLAAKTPPPIALSIDWTITQPRYQQPVDPYPNLLVTTLLPKPPPPFGQATDWTKVPDKIQVEVDVYPNLIDSLLLPKAPPPYTSHFTAPQQKREVVAEQQINTLPFILPLSPPFTVRQVTDSAPRPQPIEPPLFPNRPLSVLQTFYTDHFTQPQQKREVVAEQIVNALTLGITPAPPFIQLSASAPPRTPVTVDQPLQMPLTLGINPAPNVRQQFESAPPPKVAVEVDLPADLLTLISLPIPLPLGLPFDAAEYQGKAPTPELHVYPWFNPATVSPIALPLGLPVDTNEYKPKVPVTLDTPQRPLTLTIPAPPVPPLPLSAVRLWTSAPPPPYQVIAEQRLNLSVLETAGAQQPAWFEFDDVPAVKYTPQVDVYPNLVVNVAGVQASTFRTPLEFWPQPTYQVFADQFQNIVLLGIPPAPLFPAWFDFDPAPIVKYQPQVDVYQDLLWSTLSAPPLPKWLDHFTRPQQKYEVVAEQYINGALLHKPPAIPLGLPVDINVYKAKYQVFDYQQPNLLALGISLPIPPQLPLGLPVDVSEYQAHTTVLDWQPPNTLITGIPVPFPVIIPPTVGGHGYDDPTDVTFEGQEAERANWVKTQRIVRINWLNKIRQEKLDQEKKAADSAAEAARLVAEQQNQLQFAAESLEIAQGYAKLVKESEDRLGREKQAKKRAKAEAALEALRLKSEAADARLKKAKERSTEVAERRQTMLTLEREATEKAKAAAAAIKAEEERIEEEKRVVQAFMLWLMENYDG